MANPEHLAILKQGVKAWNEYWQEKHPTQVDLSWSDLRGLNLDSVVLPRADLTRVDLSGSSLNWAMLTDACLIRAKLIDTKLKWANLSTANLSFANLNKAELALANLNGAKLDGVLFLWGNLGEAKLRAAKLNKADLSGTDLSGAVLVGVEFTDAYLIGSNLSGAKLNGADLSRTILSKANLTNVDLYGAKLDNANLGGADLNGADLTKASLLETNLERANLNGCKIYGISAWGLKFKEATQSNLLITQPGEPAITVDNLEIAQFIYLLLNSEKIRGVIDTIARKVVLILGRFTPERKAVLDTIREELRKRDYLPVLFDFDKPATRDITETMRTLAHLSRFIIADISDPSSIPLELQAVVPDLAVPVQPLLLSGQSEFSMFVDLRKKYHWVLETHQYNDIADLLASLGEKVIAPAEQKAKELEKR